MKPGTPSETQRAEAPRPPRLRVGCSGFSYPEWKGSFYPEDLPRAEMLRFYAERFESVEINNTFYRMPKASVLRQWAEETPEGFRFVIKASQRITHHHRLKDAAEPVSFLLSAVEALEHRLGALLFQVPPILRKDCERLSRFLDLLPPGTRAALEFRHSSWFDDEVFDLLRARDMALCVAESDSDLETPWAPTAGWGYLRLRRPDYDDAALKAWIVRIRETGWSEAFVFFKHEDEGRGPQLGRRFLELAREA